MREDCGGDCGNCARCRDRERQEERRQHDRPEPLSAEELQAIHADYKLEAESGIDFCPRADIPASMARDRMVKAILPLLQTISDLQARALDEGALTQITVQAERIAGHDIVGDFMFIVRDVIAKRKADARRKGTP